MLVNATKGKTGFSDIGQVITSDALFEQADAFGDGQPFIACGVYPVMRAGGRLAQPWRDPDAELSRRLPAVAALMLEVIGALTSGFAWDERQAR